MKKVAAFLDLQGTLGGEGVEEITKFSFYPFSQEAIKILNDNNILAIVVTNQSNIAKGKITISDYERKITEINESLALKNAYFDAVYYCPHAKKDHCTCKKPLYGMVDKAKEDFNIDCEKMYVIGDMGKSDMILAKNISAKAILVLTGVGMESLNEYRDTWSEVEPDFIAENILEAVKWVIKDKLSLE